MERFGKRRLEPGRWAAAQGWKCERPRLTRLAGRAPWRGKLRLRSCVCVGPARLSLQPHSICSLLRQQHAHTPLFKAQRRSLALRAVSCGIVVRTKFDGERCCEACAQKAADGGPGG